MNSTAHQFVRAAIAAAAVLALASCTSYPYGQGGYGAQGSSTIYSQPAYPAGGYAPPPGYYEAPGYAQPGYPQPYGYAPRYGNGGLMIFEGGGGRHNDDHGQDRRRDERRPDDHGRDAGQRGGREPAGDHRVTSGEHGHDHGPRTQGNEHAPAAAPQVHPQTAAPPPDKAAQPAAPQPPAPRRDRD